MAYDQNLQTGRTGHCLASISTTKYIKRIRPVFTGHSGVKLISLSLETRGAWYNEAQRQSLDSVQRGDGVTGCRTSLPEYSECLCRREDGFGPLLESTQRRRVGACDGRVEGAVGTDQHRTGAAEIVLDCSFAYSLVH